MKRVAGKSLALAVVTLLLLSVVEAADNPVSIWQARRLVAGGIASSSSYLLSGFTGFRFTPDSFEFDAIQKKNLAHFKIDLKSLEPAVAKRGAQRLGHAYYVRTEAGKDLAPPLNQISWGDIVTAESLAAALNQLRAFANDTAAPLRTFKERAEAWRALPSKPPLPEEVWEKRLLAENAVKEKRPFEAMNYYEAGLERYPTWPQGRFNAALIAGELGFYAEAMEHMQAYLELVPDAADAQSTRGQIVIWRNKAK